MGRLLASVALSLLVLVVSQAAADATGAWGKGCSFVGGNLSGTVGTPTNVDPTINVGEIGCYRYSSDDGIHNSPTFSAYSSSSLFCFDPNLGQSISVPTSTSAVTPHLCVAGHPLDPYNPSGSCIATGGAQGNQSLNGVEGPAALQNACLRVGPGVWYFEIIGPCDVGNTCQVSVKGEQNE